ncbi:class I adenylate-forming enzyme family protein [Cognatishimia sp. F0-27]|uniref:class I adenylate-forming enzyme family protein n=1 Tax=Cognatishimia sp. F0-27 TaxID=2816855 RepID=UPI001D0C6C07|nr:AMP-binding protein [Cognatishimia sp. F0-27]MCC1493254.1 AMP-binding protein [Cognatishimia sp. F0-27]
MNTAEWLERSAARAGPSPALFSGQMPVCDYHGFRDRAAAFGVWLRDNGVNPGDRVALFSRNTPNYLIALYGLWYAGAAAVPINAKLHPREAAWILNDAGACCVFASELEAARLSEEAPCPVHRLDDPGFEAITRGAGPAPCSRSAEDLAWLFYTSGTTGTPKGVQITHGMITAMSLCYPVDVDPVSPADGAFYAAPMSHGAGLYAPIHVRQAARHIVPLSGGFNPQEVLEAGRTQGPLSMFMAPTMVQRLVHAAEATGADGTGLRTIVYGGGPMYRADIERAVAVLGPRFVQIYGQGECPMAISALSREDVADRTGPRWAERLESVGRAQSAVSIAIGDAEGRILPPGSIGEIMVRGTPVMTGYWNNPDATARTIRDGWLMTGDVGRLDADGYLTLQDRSKDVIISGGTNIYPREVEEALLHHPGVVECAVVGQPSSEWGEDIVAFVVAEEANSVSTESLDAHCLARIARFKRPKRYRFVTSLPKNNYGKILKTALRAQLENNT